MIRSCTFILSMMLFCSPAAKKPTGEAALLFHRGIDFNRGWKFMRCGQPEDSREEFEKPSFSDGAWETVNVPHTPRIEPLVVNDQWQGLCWYRKHFTVDPMHQGRKIFIEFEGAMQTADVWINGRHLLTHEGGYLPFTVDISGDVSFNADNVIAVRLDNRDNPDMPPGKPLKELDFCWYGGLYRNVKMHVTGALHITNAVSAEKEAGGGLFIRSDDVSRERTKLLVQTHVINESGTGRSFRVVSSLMDRKGREAAVVSSDTRHLAPGSDSHVLLDVFLNDPELWHPEHPYLYTVRSRVLSGDTLWDEMESRIGIRTIAFSASGGFRINGERMFLRGTNRHQEYPFIGYALSDNAQRRDAVRIKQAGFDYIRLSHYPHSPPFMDACDELGIVVMNCIPGWQFMGNRKFQELSYQNCRDLVRRDRNHACVVLWEVSLNETGMSEDFINRTNAIAHAEYPGGQCYTCGWVEGYDVFIQARQHGGCRGYSRGDKACVISEYGDWEYYAQNAGLDQPGFRDLEPEERNSRQLRGGGEKRLVQQAMNFQEAHDDNLSTPAAGDGLWVMFDYNRGYDDTIEASGVMDIFRIPKFSCYFFQSQRKPKNPGMPPMVRIASYWDEKSSPRVKVFSNCGQVALSLNGKSTGMQRPDQGRFTANLQSPPFTFELGAFQPGELEASGYVNGEKVAGHKVRTPGKPAGLQLTVGLDGVFPETGEEDVFFLYAVVSDRNGTTVPHSDHEIRFEISGPGDLIGPNPAAAEAGIAAILVRTNGNRGVIRVSASGEGLGRGEAEIEIK